MKLSENHAHAKNYKRKNTQREREGKEKQILGTKDNGYALK